MGEPHRTIILEASKSGNVSKLEAAISKLPSETKLMDIKENETGRNALLLAAFEGHIDIITKLIEDKLCADIDAHKDSQGAFQFPISHS